MNEAREALIDEFDQAPAEGPARRLVVRTAHAGSASLPSRVERT